MTRRALLVIVGLAVAAGCRPDETEEVAGADLLGMDADQVMIGMDHFVSRDGLLRARLLADTAFTFEDAAEIRLRGVDVKFFDERGAEISALSGRRGVYHTGSRDMEMKEDIVVLDRRESRRLETEELLYDASSDRLSSDVEFVLYRGNTVVRGTGFVSDPGLDTVEVVQPSGVSEGMAAPGGALRAGPAASHAAGPAGSDPRHVHGAGRGDRSSGGSGRHGDAGCR